MELYDIPNDPTQLANIAEKHPDVVARLSDSVLAWHKTLPAGPTDPGAGQVNYPWPGKASTARRRHAGGKARAKAKAKAKTKRAAVPRTRNQESLAADRRHGLAS